MCVLLPKHVFTIRFIRSSISFSLILILQLDSLTLDVFDPQDDEEEGAGGSGEPISEEGLRGEPARRTDQRPPEEHLQLPGPLRTQHEQLIYR